MFKNKFVLNYGINIKSFSCYNFSMHIIVSTEISKKRIEAPSVGGFTNERKKSFKDNQKWKHDTQIKAAPTFSLSLTNINSMK